MSSLLAFDWDPETYREWVDREVIATVRTLMWVNHRLAERSRVGSGHAGSNRRALNNPTEATCYYLF